MTTQNPNPTPTREESIATVAALIRDIRFAMLVSTTDEGHLHAQPMTTQQTEFDGDLWFIAARDSELVHNLGARPQVNVSYADPIKNNYLSIHGTAELVEDSAKLDELWSEAHRIYFEGGKEDPNIQLVKIDSGGAEYWQSGGKIRTMFALAKTLISGSKLNENEVGKNATVKL